MIENRTIFKCDQCGKEHASSMNMIYIDHITLLDENENNLNAYEYIIFCDATCAAAFIKKTYGHMESHK